MVQAVERLEYLLPDSPQTGELYVVDTADLFCALEGDASNNRRSLERVCRHLQIPTNYLHNAGNDAHVRPPLSSSSPRLSSFAPSSCVEDFYDAVC